MPDCFFVTDLHGFERRYAALFEAIPRERPDAIFVGGDLLPHGYLGAEEESPALSLVRRFHELKKLQGEEYPEVFLILGNDDPRVEEGVFQEAEGEGLWRYMHRRKARFREFTIYGYAHVPPTPFGMKDWERYDIFRHVDPGCLSPEEGWRSVEVAANVIRHSTISLDLEELTGSGNLERCIFLFHTPPYRTALDRAALDGKMIDHVPLDVNVGSIAVKRFIEERQPLVTLHGHIHEAPRLTGRWRERIGDTHAFSAAHDGPELSVVRFDPEDPEGATRVLL